MLQSWLEIEELVPLLDYRVALCRIHSWTLREWNTRHIKRLRQVGKTN